MLKTIVLQDFKLGKSFYKKGSIIELKAEDFERLNSNGFVKIYFPELPDDYEPEFLKYEFEFLFKEHLKAYELFKRFPIDMYELKEKYPKTYMKLKQLEAELWLAYYEFYYEKFIRIIREIAKELESVVERD